MDTDLPWLLTGPGNNGRLAYMASQRGAGREFLAIYLTEESAQAAAESLPGSRLWRPASYRQLLRTLRILKARGVGRVSFDPPSAPSADLWTIGIASVAEV